MARGKKTWRRRIYEVTGEYETCPDCSDRDAVSFTFGHVLKSEIEGTARASEPKVSFARSEQGKSRTRGCETCEGTGRIRVRRDTAIPAAN